MVSKVPELISRLACMGLLLAAVGFAQEPATEAAEEPGATSSHHPARAARHAFQRFKPRDRKSQQLEKLRSLQPDDEFFFRAIEGKAPGVNGFLVQHAARQGMLDQLGTVAWEQAGSRAWEAFRKVKYRGTAKSRGLRWRSIGPVTESDEAFLEPQNSSGRVTDLATGVRCAAEDCRLYVGTAGGGLWRSDRALHPTWPRWRLLNRGLESNNIGAVTLDPNDPQGMTLYVGTGESNFAFTSAAGQGLYKSTDGGDQFTRVSTMIDDPAVASGLIDFTATRGISQVAIPPGAPETIFVSTTTAMMGMTSVRGGQSSITGGRQASVGLYRTTDGGSSWEFLFEAPINATSSANTHSGIFQLISGVKDIQFDPLDAATVYISVADDGLYRSSPALDGDATFRQVFEIVGPGKSDSYAGFDLTIKDGQTRIYVYNGNSSHQDQQALYRLDNANQPASALYGGGGNTSAWVNKSVFVEPKDYVDFEVCRSQCVYDLVVVTPDGWPDTVYIGGVLTRSMGDSTIRSIDGGENFFSYAIDLQNPPGRPHVDVRAMVFSPDNPNLAFIGSDGGVVRSNGRYGSNAARCTAIFGIPADEAFLYPLCQAALSSVPQQFVFMNRGLQTMQLYNISADPNQPLSRMMAGTQDNSTQWFDGEGSIGSWSKVFNVGDGTSANGFHRENPDILFASFQSAYFFTHFKGGAGGNENWYFTSGPIQFSDERQYPNAEPGSGRQFITFDPLDADTQFTGYEHVWRTQNNGGSEASLVANDCAFSSDFFKQQCGDWEALGPYLTRTEFGAGRRGGVIVAAERSAADAGTLWTGTSLGRVFVSNNVDVSAAAVQFARVDDAQTPARFVSGIATDPSDPDRAFIAYSGFSAVTPTTPGHVFEVNREAAGATFTSLDYNLGDLPVNHLVRDDLNGDLYAATDFGVLVLAYGSSHWEVAGEGLPVVLIAHLEIHPQKRMLFAATHGMGAWYLALPPASQ